ncbi:MAG: hypothetical protein IJT65_05055 [Eubacterium sp.]|nr:hypothetical protein [Eubacterium sp.]
MSISYNGYDVNVITMPAAEELNIGGGVALNSSGKCINAANETDIIGVAVNNREGIAGVQTKGYVEMKYTGSAPSYNYSKLISNGNGGVKVYASGTRDYKVIKLDTANKIVGFIL